jgi:hypothetical protein
MLFCQRARGPGFEPRSTASKAAVLPLDDPRMKNSLKNCLYIMVFLQTSQTPLNSSILSSGQETGH